MPQMRCRKQGYLRVNRVDERLRVKAGIEVSYECDREAESKRAGRERSQTKPSAAVRHSDINHDADLFDLQRPQCKDWQQTLWRVRSVGLYDSAKSDSSDFDVPEMQTTIWQAKLLCLPEMLQKPILIKINN